MPDPKTVRQNRSKLPPRGWVKSHRAESFQAPPPSRLSRVIHGLFNAYTISIALFLLLGVFLTATYYWFEFSDRIDQRLLSGQVFTPFAGIYSAPKTLRVGEATSSGELVEYLKSAGYIEKNYQADVSRSRYSLEGNLLAIEPGFTAVIDGKKNFASLTIKFSKNSKSVDAIGDRDSGEQVQQAKLEPQILSSIAAEGDGRRKTVTFNDLPPHLIKAITVTEDRSFFEHYGVNFRGIARALWRRYEGDNSSPLANQGGSSITQQLIKNLLLSNEQTYTRKAKEAYMSLILETRLTKREIFTLYANQIYLGQQSGISIYGVGEASNVYFGKDVSQLSLPEAAFLAGIIRSPNRFNPYRRPDRVKERRNQILESMAETGDITAEQLAEYRNSDLVLRQVSEARDLRGMSYFSQYAVEALPGIVSNPDAIQHLRVYTSIDPDLQKKAYEIVNKRLASLDKYFPKKQGLNAALVSIRPKTGEVVAMVGGRDYQQNQFNRATDAMRQPGSVFKPFVYAAALNSAYDSSSRQFTAATVFKDEKKTFTFNQDSYTPGNFGDFFSNTDTTFRDALVKSKNVITVDIGMSLNIGRVMTFAHKAGFPKVEKAYPSMALGTAEATPLQVATAYTIFANLGDRIDPMPITRVASGDGRTITSPGPDRKNVIRPDVAYIMDDIMKDIINRGTAAQAQGWGFRNIAGKTAFAGKTGTSRDGWFVGFTPELITVVYVGFDGGDDLGMKGSDSAMPIWADFMKEALALHPEWNGDWAMPANVRKAEIDIRNGALIRELDFIEASALPSPSPTPLNPIDPTIAALYDDPPAEPKEIFVTDVPAEFRRVELFISGTVPNRSMLAVLNEVETSEDKDETPRPSPTPSPLNETWQDSSEPPPSNSRSQPISPGIETSSITVMICPVTRQRATQSCLNKESKTFAKGGEPKDFCIVHR